MASMDADGTMMSCNISKCAMRLHNHGGPFRVVWVKGYGRRVCSDGPCGGPWDAPCYLAASVGMKFDESWSVHTHTTLRPLAADVSQTWTRPWTRVRTTGAEHLAIALPTSQHDTTPHTAQVCFGGISLSLHPAAMCDLRLADRRT